MQNTATVLPLFPDLTQYERHDLARTAADRFLRELASIYQGERIQLTRPEVVMAVAAADLIGKPSELTMAYWLDAKHRLIEKELMAIGSIDYAEVAPRNFVRSAIHHNAAAVILAHQHPSGNPEPSQADRILTLRVRDALALIDVRLLDHIVVGDRTQTSLSQRGML